MDWNKPWNEEESESGNNNPRKWNYVFVESLKMALVLPVVILAIEIFILNTWQGFRNQPFGLLYDYLFMFSVIFLIFVIFHLLRWRRLSHKENH